MDITSAVSYLESMGFVDVVLPFVLVFTLIYAILQKIEIFKEKKINIVISLAVALGFVVPHVTGSYYQLGFDPIDKMMEILPGGALILIIILTVLIVLALVGGGTTVPSAWISWVALLGMIAFGAIVARALYPELLPYSWMSWLDDPATQSILIMLGIFAAVIWFVTGTETKEKKPFADWSRENIGGLFVPANKEKKE